MLFPVPHCLECFMSLVNLSLSFWASLALWLDIVAVQEPNSETLLNLVG